MFSDSWCVSVPPMSAVIRGPRPQLSSGQRYNLSCSATGWSPFVLVNWTLARPGAATPTLVSRRSNPQRGGITNLEKSLWWWVELEVPAVLSSV